MVTDRRPTLAFPALLLLAGLLLGPALGAQTLYKYRGGDGEWIFSDRPPDDIELVDETRDLETGTGRGLLTVATRPTARGLEFVAQNQFFAPVEVALRFKSLTGFEFPDPDAELAWVLPGNAQQALITLVADPTRGTPAASYEYEYMVGSPEARHEPTELYRVPFATATDYRVTQAYPDVVTHQHLRGARRHRIRCRQRQLRRRHGSRDSRTAGQRRADTARRRHVRDLRAPQLELHSRAPGAARGAR